MDSLETNDTLFEQSIQLEACGQRAVVPRAQSRSVCKELLDRLQERRAARRPESDSGQSPPGFLNLKLIAYRVCQRLSLIREDLPRVLCARGE